MFVGAQWSRACPSRRSWRAGKLHFVKFETSRVEDAIDFIEAKGLHRHYGRNGPQEMRVKATGASEVPRAARHALYCLAQHVAALHRDVCV